VSDYQAFLDAKVVTAPVRGLDSLPSLAGYLFAFQRAVVEFGLRNGSWGCYLATGLGKSACELEWAAHAAAASNGRALILTPLAVARQMEREGQRWGYGVRVIRQQSEAREGINVCNYERLERLDPDAFGAVAFDESSIVKAWNGKTSRALFSAFGRHRWRMAASATPAPNDHIELGQQSELLGVMPLSDMLVRWFINDTADTGTWRLKGHAVGSFWDWMASWSRMAEHPRDLGDAVEGYDLPPMRIIRHHAEGSAVSLPGEMFAGITVNATNMHDVKRQTAEARAELAARIVTAEPTEPWLLWVDTDYEADAVSRALGEVIEVRGSHPVERKEAAIEAFVDGTAKRLLTKPSVAGWGLNFQHCARMVFVGRSFSFEMWHQAVRRCWRFGQSRPVDVHLIVADGEEAIGRVIDRKTEDHNRMQGAMVAAMKRAVGSSARHRVAYEPKHSGRLPSWMRSAS
jgi:hypothetical protein